VIENENILYNIPVVIRLEKIVQRPFQVNIVISLEGIKLTINVPLILTVRDFMFFGREKHIISHFKGFFEGDETFLTSKLS
jgi:hypothetical protein